jgi:hypothetical protein
MRGLLVVAVLLAMCGNAAAATVVIHQRYVREPGGPVYIEGSIHFVKIMRPDGRKVLGTRRSDLRRSLPPGRYRIVGFQRACAGTCDYLDGPSDRCRTRLRVRRGRTVTITVRHRTGRPCLISIRTSGSA